jgi:hypothetical protein
MVAALCPFCDIPMDERPSLLCDPSNHAGYRGPSVEVLLLAPRPPTTRDVLLDGVADVHRLAAALDGPRCFCGEKHGGAPCPEAER